MRNHRLEGIARKSRIRNCLSMRQRRRIREEVKLIQESVAVENKRDENRKEGQNSIADDRINQQEQQIHSQNIVYIQSQQQVDNCRVPQFVQQSANSFPDTQQVVDPLLPTSTISENFSFSMNFLPGPSGFQDGAPAENGLSSTFKTEPFTENNQGMESGGDQQQQAPLNHQDHNLDIVLELRKLNLKMDTYNNHLLAINSRLETIERHVMQEKRKGQAPAKPGIIPMQTVQEVIEFDNASDEVYNGLVKYLKYIGGFTLREALNLCMKEVLTNDVANNFTWHGKDTGHAQVGLALYSRQITNAFYEAVSQSQHFEQPTRAMFASQMREVLRIAKQRLRNSLRKQQVQQNFDGDRDDDPWE
ncbi:uncharacterized protein LOC122503428 [Leptopilina heterotoma]|uniref:uncharacterized protein LOC122503428 n=1 Tax=Leptopilina heterotoma TaxID=63436 RepID=UPI001CA9E1CB|nr:uncharacterized protein LOC122503428 [Leptopilina heterotoma]